MSDDFLEADPSLYDLLADPMVRLVMLADGVDEREIHEIFARAAADMKKPSLLPIEARTTSRSPPDDGGFRRGVGIMLVNGSGHVFVGQRIDVSVDAWQMPQGGIEIGECPRNAALREVHEELGTSNVEVVIGTEKWFQYELPREILARAPRGCWRGQQQKWFLMRFKGTDEEINVATECPEFSTWKWVSTQSLIEAVVPFKRTLYQCVVQEFQHHFVDASPHVG